MKPTYLATALLLIGSIAFAADAPKEATLPPGEKEAKERIEKSPRHGEYVDIEVPGRAGPIKAYVVYPEKKDKAPVVIVIHEIFGLSDWIKGVSDQLAADGFIAVAPDLLSGKGTDGKGTDGFASRDDVVKAVQKLKPDEVTSGLNAVMAYGKKIPASNGKTGTVGFCWGGGQSFAYAVNQPELGAAVVYYGTNPSDAAALEKLQAPVLGLYGGEDARVGATVPPAEAGMKKAGKTYSAHTFAGAGHGFLRQQDGKEGANLKAAQEAWPLTVQFLHEQIAK